MKKIKKKVNRRANRPLVVKKNNSGFMVKCFWLFFCIGIISGFVFFVSKIKETKKTRKIVLIEPTEESPLALPEKPESGIKTVPIENKTISKPSIQHFIPPSVDLVESKIKQRNYTRKFKIRVDGLKEGFLNEPDGTTMQYRYFVPSGLKKSEKVPLVLFLHGIGEAGHDNRKQLAKHPQPLVFVQPWNQEEFPCFFVAPQLKEKNGIWCGGDFDSPSENLRKAVAIVDELIQNYSSIDKDRIYVTGLSSGGIGAWDALAKFPNKFAAAVPISAGWDPNMIQHKQKVSAWAFYNEQEGEFTKKYCNKMLAKIKKNGGEARITAYPMKGHGTWKLAYGEPELIPWLFKQKRKSPYRF